MSSVSPSASHTGFDSDAPDALTVTDELVQQQRDLERESMDDESTGRLDRLIASKSDRVTSPLRTLQQRLEEGLMSILGQTREGSPSAWIKLVREVTPERAARVTLTVLLKELVSPGAMLVDLSEEDEAKASITPVYHSEDLPHMAVSTVELARLIIRQLAHEARYVRMKTHAPGLLDYVQGRLKNTSSKVFKAKSLSRSTAYAAKTNKKIITTDLDALVRYDSKPGIGIGLHLITLAVEVGMTGLLRFSDGGRATHALAKERHTGKHPYVPNGRGLVTWTDDGARFCDNLRDRRIETLAVFHPMLVPPNDWGHEQQGGYIDRQKHLLTFVRGASEQSSRERVGRRDYVYRAVNRIQATPWRVNKNVLRVVEYVVESRIPENSPNGYFAGIPRRDVLPLPSKPADIGSNEKAKAEWTKRAHEVHEKNRPFLRDILKFYRTTYAEAQRFSSVPAFYFPHTVDFRGRCYPATNTGLSPQGDDLQKGLLEFAVGKPLGPHGRKWLALHGANMLGDPLPHTGTTKKVSKMTIAERLEYIGAITPLIQQIAREPMSNRGLWAPNDDDEGGAGDPWSFLAFCFEWAELTELESRGCGQEFRTHLPCAIDGSCNGLQNYAMMLRDLDTALEVNVTASPDLRPKDFYGAVASVSLNLVEADCVRVPSPETMRKANNPKVNKHGKAYGHKKYVEELQRIERDRDFAKRWMAQNGIIDRKLAKGPAMTLVYGAANESFAKKILERVKKVRLTAHFESGEHDNQQLTEKELKKARERTLEDQMNYMARVVRAGIEAKAPKPTQAMDFLRSAAELLGNAGKYVEWEVPLTGFKVKQDYVSYTGKGIRLDTQLHGAAYVNEELRRKYGITDLIVQTPDEAKEREKRERFTSYVGREANGVDVAAQVRGVAPNLCHSLDAAALHTTVLYASDEIDTAEKVTVGLDPWGEPIFAAGGWPIDSFAMIHDSFGTHAGDMERLSYCARLAYLQLYWDADDNRDNTLLDYLRREWIELFGIDVGKPPVRPGNLAREDVLESPYFFI